MHKIQNHLKLVKINEEILVYEKRSLLKDIRVRVRVCVCQCASSGGYNTTGLMGVYYYLSLFGDGGGEGRGNTGSRIFFFTSL